MKVYLVFHLSNSCRGPHGTQYYENADVAGVFANQIDAALFAEQMNDTAVDDAWVVEERQVHESLETVNV